jgi:hypothetical protein
MKIKAIVFILFFGLKWTEDAEEFLAKSPDLIFMTVWKFALSSPQSLELGFRLFPLHHSNLCKFGQQSFQVLIVYIDLVIAVPLFLLSFCFLVV